MQYLKDQRGRIYKVLPTEPTLLKSMVVRAIEVKRSRGKIKELNQPTLIRPQFCEEVETV